MKKVIIDSFDEAREKASNLSDNLYYDTDFSPSAFRTFLDHLPSILRVFVQITVSNGDSSPGLCTVFFDPEKSSINRTSISIVFNGLWLIDTYFKFFRVVPRTYLFTYEYDGSIFS